MARHGLIPVAGAQTVFLALFFAARLRRVPALTFAVPLVLVMLFDVWLIHAATEGVASRFDALPPDQWQSTAILLSPFFIVALVGVYGAIRLQFDRRYPRFHGLRDAFGMLTNQWLGSRHGVNLSGLILIICAAIFFLAGLWIVVPLAAGFPRLRLGTFFFLTGYLYPFALVIGPAAIVASVLLIRAHAMRRGNALLLALLVLCALWEVSWVVAWWLRLSWPFNIRRLSYLISDVTGDHSGTADVLILAAPLLLCAALTARAARQIMTVSASVALARDQRQPILLLRSFIDDTKTIEPYGWIRRALRQTRRLEEIAAQVVSEFGPFVAIGRPGERLPELGASRNYFEAETWQGAVLEWMQASRYVVMIGGITEAIAWELRAIIERDLLHKLIIVIPPARKADTGTRLEQIAICFAETPWGEAVRNLDRRRVRILCFPDQDRLLGIECRSRREADYFISIHAAIDALSGEP